MHLTLIIIDNKMGVFMREKFVIFDFCVFFKIFSMAFFMSVYPIDDDIDVSVFTDERCSWKEIHFARSLMNPNISVSGPLKIETNGGSTQFAPGAIYMYGKIYLGNSDNDVICVQGKNIISDNTNIVCLGIDQKKNIITMNNSGLCYQIGDSNGSYVVVDNTGANGIMLNSGDLVNGGPIILGSGIHDILLQNSSIEIPQGNTVNLVGINQSGALVTVVSPIFSSLVGVRNNGDYLSLGDVSNKTNGIYFEYAGGDMIISANSNKIGNETSLKVSTQNHIYLSSADLLTSDNTKYALYIDNNNIISSGPLDYGNLYVGNSLLQSSAIFLGADVGNVIKFYNNIGGIVISSGAQVDGVITLSSASDIILDSTSLSIFNAIPLPQAGCTSVLIIDSNGKIGIAISSKRFKTDIKTLPNMSDDFENLEVVSYRYRDSNRDIIGFIAEDIVKETSVLKDYLIIYDQNGNPLSIDYNGLIALNTQQIVEDKIKIKYLEGKISTLENELVDHLGLINELKTKIEVLMILCGIPKV